MKIKWIVARATLLIAVGALGMLLAIIAFAMGFAAFLTTVAFFP